MEVGTGSGRERACPDDADTAEDEDEHAEDPKSVTLRAPGSIATHDFLRLASHWLASETLTLQFVVEVRIRYATDTRRDHAAFGDPASSVARYGAECEAVRSRSCSLEMRRIAMVVIAGLALGACAKSSA